MNALNLNGAQVQTLRNWIAYGDEVTLTEAPAGAVLVDWKDGRKGIIDTFGGFGWRYS